MSINRGGAATGARKTDAACKMIQRRIIPACEPVLCWGLHGGREWIVVGSSHGHLSILCNGAAGASNDKKTFSLWQTIKLGDTTDSSNGESSHGSMAPKTGSSASQLGTSDNMPPRLIPLINQTSESKTASDTLEDDSRELRVTALSWCKFPSVKLGEHPLDSDARYCAGFAAGSYGRISIFYPTVKNPFEWELVSVLRPLGDVHCLSWAPEGHHLVSGGDQLILWSPDSSTAMANSCASSVAGSVTSAPALSAEQRQLYERSPAFSEGDNKSETGETLPSGTRDDRAPMFDASWILECEDGQHIALNDFSGDGRLFATQSNMSIEVRVWFEGDSLFGNLDYVPLYHPKAVLSLMWRPRANASSLHCKPRNSHTPQSLITLCRDQVIRVWQESDPQTEEFNMFVAATIDTSGELIRSISWLQFINYFEGMRSPFPEHNSYYTDREDFVEGFTSGSPFFHTSAHFSTVWGTHQSKSTELRTGPIAQESRSSLDWIVALDRSGKVWMWSIEGLSDSPRRDIHCLPWSQASRTIFEKKDPSQVLTPYIFNRSEDVYHAQHRKRTSSFRSLTTPGSESPISPLTTGESRGVPQSSNHNPQWLQEDTSNSAFDRSYINLVATCRVTQEFDPHIEKDPWPTTSVFDINPKTIEVIGLSDSGVTYTFGKANENPDVPFGTTLSEELCLARGHTAEIVRVRPELVVDHVANHSPVEESYWVTSMDAEGYALAWPVRSGSADEEIDADALVRRGSVSLPRRGRAKFASCSEVAPGRIVAFIVTDAQSLEVWERQRLFKGESISRGEQQWVRLAVLNEDVGEDCSSLFVVRDSNFKLVVCVSSEGGEVFFAYRVSRSPEEEEGQPTMNLYHELVVHRENLGAWCVCGVNDGHLLRHGVLALAACTDGYVRLLGADLSPNKDVKHFQSGATSADPITQLSNSRSGKLVTVQDGSGTVKVWHTGMCHLRFTLHATIVPKQFHGACRVTDAYSLYLGADIDLVAVALEALPGPKVSRKGYVTSPMVVVYSSKLGGSFDFEEASFVPIGSTEGALSGTSIRGVAWSGRDFGLAIATDCEMHLFQGWFRHPFSPNTAKELKRIRSRMDREGKPVAWTPTMQATASNSVGDTAVGLQLPLPFHHPRVLLEMLRSGWTNQVRSVLVAVLKRLQDKDRLIREMYGDDEKPEASEMRVLPPNIILSELLANLSDDGFMDCKDKNKKNDGGGLNFNEEPEVKPKETAADLFSDGWGYDTPSKPIAATLGAASALFQEDPWESVLTKSNIDAKSSQASTTGDFSNDSELCELLMRYTVQELDSRELLLLNAIANVFDGLFGISKEQAAFGDGIDDAGRRFLLAYQVFRVSSRCLAPLDRPRAMSTADIVWAYESDSQEALLTQCVPTGSQTWQKAKLVGVGLWLKAQDSCKTLAESMAKEQYAKGGRDPFSCALFYFALGKSTVVSGLFRLVKNYKAAEMLANDFNEPHWQGIAVKNGFSLLKQKKYEAAASFFILGRDLAKAANVCMKNMNDFQLAIFLCKIVEGPCGPVQKALWRSTVLPLAKRTKDPWLASLGYSVLGYTSRAVLAFVLDPQMEFQENQPEFEDDFESKSDVASARDEVLANLETSCFPSLTTRVDSLEPVYVRYMVCDARRQHGLRSIHDSGFSDRVVQHCIERAAKHLASMGVPILALHELQQTKKYCEHCGNTWKTTLSAHTFHPFLVAAHKALSRREETIDDDDATNSDNGSASKTDESCAAGEDSQQGIGPQMPDRLRFVRSRRELNALRKDLDSILQNISHANGDEVLESLWRISRASNHLSVELTIVRLLGRQDGSFVVRLQQLFNSIMASLIALGQSKVDVRLACDRRLLPARRLAAYTIFLIDLGCADPKVFAEAGLGDDPAFVARMRLLLDSYARVALLCAAFLMEQVSLIKFLLSSDFSVSNIRNSAIQLALNWFDYEELLVWAPNAAPIVASMGTSNRSLNISGGIEYEDDDPDLSKWGSVYAKKLMDVVTFRSLLCLLIQKREEIAMIQKLNQLEDPAMEFCEIYIEELLQSCWPLNWTLLSDLQVCRIPVGMSSIGASRLEAMKERAFNNESKDQLWRFLKGKEQLRILDATAKWTDRSLDQARARAGYIPDPTVFCAENVKEVFSQPGSLLLSVDPINAVESTIVVASEQGTEVVSFSFASDEADAETSSDDDVEDAISVASMGGHKPSSQRLSTFHVNMRASMPPRTRERSLSDSTLEHFEVPTVDTGGAFSGDSNIFEMDESMISAGGQEDQAEPRRRTSPVHLHLPRPRRPHIHIKGIRPGKKKRAAQSVTANKLTHSWSNSARSLLLVSKGTDALWWGDEVHMPLNQNLYGDSYVHNVSSHQRVKHLLRKEQYSNETATPMGSPPNFSIDGLDTRSVGDRTPVTARSPNEPVRPVSEYQRAPSSARSPSPILRPVSVGGSTRRSLLPKVTRRTEEANKTVMHVQSHPYLPFFAAGTYDGSCYLVDAEKDEMIVQFNKPVVDWKPSHVTRVRFAEDGLRLASCDSAGQVLLWNVADSHAREDDPFIAMQGHTKRALDCTFMNYNGSMLATVGQSSHSENLCLWDLSLPPSSRRVAKLACCSHSAAYSVAHLQDEQVLIIGGGNGQLAVFDLRQRVLLAEEEHVHHKAIRSLAVHPSRGHYFGSGSTDGSVKLWSYRGGRPMSHAHLTNMHPTHTFMNEATSDSLISQRGTTDLAFSRDFLYTCGADGSVKMTPLSSLMM